MKIFGFEVRKVKGKVKRLFYNYAAARQDRLTADWKAGNLVSDEVLRQNLAILRNRSRSLEQDNDYMKNFLRKLKVNVVGAHGIGMQSKARKRSGDIDKKANALIEEAWVRWCKKKNVSVCQSLSMTDLLGMALIAVARDGEVLIRKIKGYDNPFKFALQVLESDHLDERLNVDLPNGNKIRLGIEKDTWGKPVAYYLLKTHPGERAAMVGQQHIRVPVSEIIHAYIKDRPSQSRGVPWAHTAVLRLRMLGAFEEAAVVAARVGASKMGFIIPPEGSTYQGDDVDERGNIVQEVEPGMLEWLPAGYDIKDFNAQYPAGEFPPFVKSMLRGVSAGMGCSYNSIASDLEGVNFSSLRSGLLEERDVWKVLQQWFVSAVLEDVYDSWLEMAMLSGQLLLPIADFDRLNAPKWQPRTWEWVDPLKDINARIASLNAGLTTRTAICAEHGIDFEELVEQLAAEKEILDAYGISFVAAEGAVVVIDRDEVEHEEEAIKKGGNGNEQR